MALAAGVSLVLAPDGHVIASRGRMLSPRGFCSTFDASADGYVRGEGCAVVLLKRLSDAQADGDRILALVRGTASNQDGRSGGLTVPSGTAQEEVMRTALTVSGLQPADVDYVEAHGTGTELGDPIEIHALAGVHAGRPADRPLLVGSVKTNVGHLEGAAGLAGVVKTVIALRDGVIPPHIHFSTPNPHINWDAAPIRIPTEATPWPRPERRIAGVSSFGFSGTNVHVILEGAPQETAAAEAPPPGAVLVPLSARTPAALAALAARIANRMEAEPQLTLSAVARTLARGRGHWEERAAIVAETRAELIHQLRQLAAGSIGTDSPTLRVGTANRKRTPRVAFLFTGQGAQRPEMGRELLVTEPVFRAAVERCDALLADRLGVSIAELLRADPEDGRAAETLRQTHVTQPALFVLEYALAELWRSRGVEPTVVAGHSIGEFAAACVAGILSLEDALMLVAERGRLMGALPEGGAMATLFAAEEEVRERLSRFAGRASLAAVNAPGNTVVSGDEDAIDALLAEAAADGIQGRRLVVSHAFHSHRMDPAVPAFRDVAARVAHAVPSVDIIAAATGERAGATTFGADYWARQLRDPVLFGRTVEAVRAEGAGVLLEIGPAPVLLSLAASCPGAAADEVRQPSLRPGTDASRAIAEALGALYVAGVPLDWSGVYPGPLHPVSLPTYPFERQHHWFTPRRRVGAGHDGHPLLGRRVESPHFAGTIFENVLSEDQPEWIAEHRVFGRPVLPAAAYVEMCRAAVTQVAGEALRPARLRILEALTIEGDTPVQTIVDRDAGVVRVASRDAGGAWRIHVEGVLETPAAALSAPLDATADLQADVWESIDVADMLARIEENGVAYGSAFRGLRGVRRQGNVAVGTLVATQISARERRRHGLHPALLDAAFQLCGATIDGSDAVYLPVEVGAIAASPDADAEAGDTLQARATLREGGADAAVLVCDVEVRGGGERLLIEGLRFQRARRSAPSLEQRVAEWLYQPVWERVEVAGGGRVEGRYLVVGEGELARAVVGELERRGGEGEAVIPAEVSQMLSQGGSGERFAGIVIATQRFSLPDSGDAIARSLQPLLAPVLDVGRAIASEVAVDRIALVTRDGCEVRAGESVVDPGAAALWALGHTIAAELKNVLCIRVDLAGELPLESAAVALVDALAADSVEDRLALRADGWYGMRLERIPPHRESGARPGPDYQLVVETSGDLDTLTLRPYEVGSPLADEVTIRVEATGLNFRDVLNALGMYPGDAGPLGSECVGVVEKVGTADTGLKVGDRVMSITPQGFCSRVNSAAALTVALPHGLSAAEGATIPIAFLTADWALFELANLREGERVLIHAAAGGVGQAAVQLAQAVGAEIYATAGSPQKRALLSRLGVQHVYDSRSTEFRDQILADTGGAGVDVVLNSLADEFIPASIEVLAERGRFIEIGKTGIWDREAVQRVRPRAMYEVLYLGEACAREPLRVRERFLRLAARFQAGDLQPLRVRSFVLDDATGAFRYMAQARHIGKVVLHDSEESIRERSAGATWITGGLGGIGLAIARQLADAGHTRLVLTSRSQPDTEIEAQLNEIRAAGAQVEVFPGDVSKLEEVERIRDAILARGWRLDHLYHAAAVLDDAALPGQHWQRVSRVLEPKAGGAWNLHRATRMLHLRSFVLFSAGAGLLGSPGQANYAAANGFLDGLARYRRSVGLPATSLLWGPWADVGMAARAGLDWAKVGLRPINPEEGVAALQRLVIEEWETPLVLAVDWGELLAHQRSNPLFSRVAPADAVARGVPEVLRVVDLTILSVEERRDLIERYTLQNISTVLGLQNGRLEPQSQVLNFGFDSLMAVELRNRIESDFGVVLPAAALLGASTPYEIGELILEVLDGIPVGGADGMDSQVWDEGEI